MKKLTRSSLQVIGSVSTVLALEYPDAYANSTAISNVSSIAFGMENTYRLNATNLL